MSSSEGAELPEQLDVVTELGEGIFYPTQLGEVLERTFIEISKETSS